ncbi:cytochrome c oxidase assembly protein COX20, mitochondrial [Scaptodrosophila lebanonensis]|uniref:Cytochrome c oxidase assembly protein COX20, mitochondrial n=1 Tax=Drosophila lebanonensis TaxID=7225 RepID=A0A6J2T6A7_DROLE|nr:cytochrome c oxidase assembly protein COX20, mitochondrial [Scaptodrosophila lebanonensis]
MADDAEEPSKSFIIFGRDIAQIPCFRNSFLYGISGGIGIGLLTFLGTSRPHFSTHVGFGSFFCGTIVYWFGCRYQWSVRRFEQRQLQEAMRQQAMYEGTETERELDLKSA